MYYTSVVKRLLLYIVLLAHMVSLANATDAMLFTGIAKNTGKPCSLKVLNTTETENPYTVQVEATIYDTHESADEVFLFTVKLANNSQGFNIFSGVTAEKDQLNIFVSENSMTLTQVKKFSVKWIHVDHYHGELCEGLKLND
jgi:hypothetical protein